MKFGLHGMVLLIQCVWDLKRGMRGGEVGFRSQCGGWRACTREHACVGVAGSSRRWRSSGEVCQCKTRVRPCVVEVPRWEASAEGGACGVLRAPRAAYAGEDHRRARGARVRNPRGEPGENERGVRVDDAPSGARPRLSPARQAARGVEFRSMPSQSTPSFGRHARSGTRDVLSELASPA